ncbi:hypothetical protein ES708_34451 [subsurface metagenome]
MDEKELKAMMTSLKGLAYARQSALQTILEVLEQEQLPPEERLERIEMIVKSTGVTLWKDK